MAKVYYIYPIDHMSGPVKTGSNQSFAHRGFTNYTYTRQNDRDYIHHPVTSTEASNQRNFGDAVRAYQMLKKIPFHYEAFLQQFQNYQIKSRADHHPCYANPYTYFLGLYRSGQI